MNIIQNIKNYFNSKAGGNTAANAPKGIWPNYWGKPKWEAEFYKLNKENKLDGNDQTYANFIHKIIKTTIEELP